MFSGPRFACDVRFVGAAATSTALILAFAIMANTPLRRVLLAVPMALIVVLNVLVFRYYHATFDLQILASALAASHDVRPVALRALPGFLAAVVALAGGYVGLLTFGHRVLGRRAVEQKTSLSVVLVVAAFGGALGTSPRYATPEIRAFHALVALRGRPETAVRGDVRLPPLYSSLSRLPHVLVILTESVRASEYQTSGIAPTAPALAAVTPGRVELRQFRSVASYTALSLSAILTGRSQEAERASIVNAPGLFDFARAARDAGGDRPAIRYYSSQPSSVFETERVRAAVDTFVSLETLRGRDVEDDPDYGELPLDREMLERFVRDLPELPSPSLVMLHLAGTHAPYFVDPAHAPFAPYDHVVTWSGMPSLLNAYRNAIFEQDRLLAQAVEAFLRRVGHEPWLVVFTSDHGEAFGDHGAIHHGQNLLDEQVHVPAWIAHGSGALPPQAVSALEDHQRRFLTHLDVLPTILDSLGIWDNSAVRSFRERMPGRSLLRPFEPRSPIPVTNCTGMFPCPLDTWGLFAGDRKLLARAWDTDWSCLALDGASELLAPAHDAACGHLREVSKATFERLPNGNLNR
jgi:hypothetical protein